MELHMKDTISFSVPGSNSVHELQLGLTLIRFIGFDLKYFGEQCVQIYRQQLSAGEDAFQKAMAFKELLRNCHPYCASLLHSEFDKIALDCIIEYISTSENVGLEELWVKNLSAADRFGKALFERITEYKTGYAINQWTNILRMQAYAAAKTAVIYGSSEADSSVHKARKLYYDTAFRMTASMLGFGSGDLPNVKVSGVAFLPESLAMMKNAVNTLEPVIQKKMDGIEARAPLKGRDCVQDHMAGMALNVMMNLKRPEIDEMLQLIQTYGFMPNMVYEPSSFKAVIDLEFDQLIEKGFYLRAEQKSYARVKYSARREAEKAEARPDIIVHADIPAAREADIIPPAVKRIIPAVSILADLSAPPEEKKEPEAEPPSNIKNVVADLGNGSIGKVKSIIEMAEDPKRKESKKRTLQEVNMRCNLIWTSMNVRSGWSITSEEASEWFRYLTRLRYGIGTGELTPGALDKFLDATLEVYQLLPEDA
jgi:hypothetical protein